MGKVRTILQVDQGGNQSGLEMLEITYGGLEAPFGGIDSSAPPAYIDPRCFADAEGFLVVDNKLVVGSFLFGTTPTLWGSVAGVKLLKFGTFYSSIYGQLNYALGYKSLVHFGHLPTGNSQTVYTFFMTSWNAETGALVDNSTFNLTLYETSITATPASITLPVLMGESADYTDSGNLVLAYGVSNAPIGSVSIPYTPGMTVANIVAAAVPLIDAAFAVSGFHAAASLDGLSIVLIAVTPGITGNNLQVADNSVSGTPLTNAPAFYFPIAISPSWTNLVGGVDGSRIGPPLITHVSTAEVGGILYIAGLGPYILKYSGPNSFQISTAYNGVKVLSKFGGSLIGLGTIAQLGTVLQNTDMIFSWSSALNLDEWSPVDSSGFVTGAGFEQLADIADYLTGLVVSNNVAYIIRSQGLSYAIATSNGTQPFQINHIGLGDQGEGAQLRELICQYDQAGAYVGNTDIFQLAGGITSIGQKIKAALFSDLEGANNFLDSAACSVFIGNDAFPVAAFMIGEILYVYNTNNQTWMKFSRAVDSTETAVKAGVTYLQTTDNLLQSVVTVGIQETISAVVQPPEFLILAEGVNTGLNPGTSLQPQITFPQEELLFGRDVTIDALYIALWANISAGLNNKATLNFFFNGVLFATQDLLPAQFNTLSGAPVEMKIFPTNTNGTGVFTSHSPQLKITVSHSPNAAVRIRFSKIQEYATFEPNQRPV